MVLLLANRTWREVRLTSQAHGLRFDTNQTKQAGTASVRAALLDEGCLKRAYRHLSDDEREPLCALQIAGGSLHLHRFTAAFGAIRPYKPWANLAARFFYKRPVSPAEKLWHLGMVEIDRDTVYLPDEVACLLPPPPRPQPLYAVSEAADGAMTLLHDLAALMGGLLAGEGRWIRGRWLTPRSLRHLNRRLLRQDDLSGVRSERQAGRIRFLHYLLDVTGLLKDGQPTPQAWAWLSAPDQWGQLWSAVRDDLDKRDPVWDEYALPAIDLPAWDKLTTLLETLSRGQVYTRDTLYAPLRFDLSRTAFDVLLDTVLYWGNWVCLQSDHVWLSVTTIKEAPAHFSRHWDSFYIDMTAPPPLPAFVEVSSWAQVESAQSLRVDADAVRRAVQQGYDAGGIIRALAELCASPLSVSDSKLIRQWVQMAQSVTLRTVHMLTVTDEAVMQCIRADWRLRPLLGEALSPHHHVVQTAHIETLSKKLARRGYPVTLTHPSGYAPLPAEYVYLAICVYRQLSQLIPPEVRLPGAVVEAARQTLTPERITASEQTAARIITTLHRTFSGTQAGRGGVAQDDPNGIITAIESAHKERQPVRIRYYSPYTGEETTRTIEPITLYSRNGARYVEAWCQLDEDTRTFRLDRILRILDED